jgi:ESS family glutamate:Na+ symporter
LIEFDLIHTLAFGGVALLVGYGLCRRIPVLGRYNIPPPVVGGLLVALVFLIAHERGVTLFKFDTTLQTPLMIAFFTTIGFAASLSLLRVGGPQVLRFFLLATAFAVLQNIIGILVALPFGLDPLFGVLAGSVTLTGGPATGLAFAPLFEQAGVPGAASVAVAVAMGGIVLGGVIGGPVSTYIINRHRLNTHSPNTTAAQSAATIAAATHAADPTVASVASVAEDEEASVLPILRNIVVILVAMWAGSWLSRGFSALGLTLPAYIGAMLVAAAIRNIDDATGWFGLSQRFINHFGAVALALFLVLALMTLKLWELATLAWPLITILIVQMLAVALIAIWPTFGLMGRNYEAAVMSGGFIGFMLGTTANAMAVMRTLVERYGPAPRAFLVAPMVGAFFIDFTNAIIVTVFLNIFA